MARGEIDLDPFRERFEASGLRVIDVARRMERDPELVRRMLKRRPYYKSGRGKETRGLRLGPYYHHGATYEIATELARAMEIDPYEMGL
jgi:hypothetical protein